MDDVEDAGVDGFAKALNASMDDAPPKPVLLEAEEASAANPPGDGELKPKPPTDEAPKPPKPVVDWLGVLT
jgi:hypothetical protein